MRLRYIRYIYCVTNQNETNIFQYVNGYSNGLNITFQRIHENQVILHKYISIVQYVCNKKNGSCLTFHFDDCKYTYYVESFPLYVLDIHDDSLNGITVYDGTYKMSIYKYFIEEYMNNFRHGWSFVENGKCVTATKYDMGKSIYTFSYPNAERCTFI